ncbi:MAG: peptidoglycan DD-metalloendopeptidase family protein [Candidatus Gracilibacteria bacterium]|nr:peptidoglycan DD-metalloendopeptidase family protein [Candidatus Gracilibacteria bacterium]
MNKFYLSLFFLFLTIFGVVNVNVNVNALSNDQVGAVLKNFQAKQYDLLFESDLGSFSSEYSDIFSISKKIDVYNSMSDDITSDKKLAEEKKQQLVSTISSLEDSIALIDKDIEKTSQKIDQINIDVIKTKNEIETNTKTIELLKKKIDENTEILLEYLVYIYKKTNTAYEGSEIDNLKSILLNNEPVGDLINDLYFKGIIQVTGKKLIDNHRLYVGELYLKKVTLEKQEQNLKTLRKQGVIEQKILQDKKDFKQSILDASKGKQSFYEQYLKEKVKLENEVRLKALKEQIKLNVARTKILEKYNCDYVDVSQNTSEVRVLEKNNPRCFSINTMIYSESQLSKNGSTDKDTTVNPMRWPVNPIQGLSTYYHDEEYKELFGAEHNAIDIKVPQGTSIESPMDGYVVYLNPPTTQDYSYLAVKHADGYLTVYGHLSEILVEQYEYVEKGQIIAKSGGEYGTMGAGYVTTGPHLHFEVFKDKQYLDPLSVLDLSYIKYQELPSKYREKYNSDFESKNGYNYSEQSENSKLFKLEGDNEVERQQYLISHYAVGTFNNWQMWIDEALDGNVDPSLVMCIGLAESGLGKNLTTAYNIGNVGNNDRGDRKGFDNARQGVYSIIYTLNGKYLGKYNSLAELSGAGRKEVGLQKCGVGGPCYATDEDHWHNNVKRCLTHLKGVYVPDDYNFRLIK